MVGHNACDVHRQLSAMGAKQQVVQAVALAADQDQYTAFALGIVNLRLHVEFLSQRREGRFPDFDRKGCGQRELHAQNKMSTEESRVGKECVNTCKKRWW